VEMMRSSMHEAYPISEEGTNTVVELGEVSPFVLDAMMHLTQHFLINHADIMRPICGQALPTESLLPMEQMIAPMLAHVAHECRSAVDPDTTADTLQNERGTMHPVYGLWERIHSLHVPIELHPDMVAWLHQYCA